MGMDPFTVGLIVSTVVGAGTAIYQGEEQKKSANAQADQAEADMKFQSDQAKADAKAEKDAAELQADSIRKAGREQRAKAKAASAASGMDVGMGTAVDLQTEIATNVESDAQMSIFGGMNALKRGNQTAQSLQIRGHNEGTALRNQGKAAQSAGYVGAAKAAGSGYTDYKTAQSKKA